MGSALNDRDISRLSSNARSAVAAGDWRTVSACAKGILERDRDSAEGHFLTGLAAKAAAQADRAEKSFRRTLAADHRRYDAALELADLYVRLQRNSEALRLLDEYRPHLGNSPLYLGMAADAYSRLDLHESAWPLYRKACDLQPQVDKFQAGLAACSVFVGKTDEARVIYESLLARQPNHQRYHYQLARLATATDFRHVDRMRAVLDATKLPPEKNIFIWYALGKELEDLGAWDEAFGYYEAAGRAAKSASGYEVETDLADIETVSSTCDEAWQRAACETVEVTGEEPAPVFIVGLPRSGTTLTERITASHSKVRSVGETYFLRAALRRESGVNTNESMNPEIIRAAATASPAKIRSRYLDAVTYKLGDEPLFIEKLPENWLYLGFIARSFPEARIVHVRRNPMDSCFALFKQSWFRYAYTLEDVGRYYVAYDRLMSHWRSTLGGRMTEVGYESLVADQEGVTRRLLDALGLDFEEACLRFEENAAPSNTASSVQIREKMHSRSVDRWRRFERQLAGLREYLEEHGVDLRPG